MHEIFHMHAYDILELLFLADCESFNYASYATGAEK